MKKRLVILGAGESGAGSAILGLKQGYDVFVSDKGAIKSRYKTLMDAHDVKWEENAHTEELILNADEVIKSPGIPDKAPIVQKLKEKNIPVLSEIEFAGRYTNAKMICITGSNGKTTTTLLTYHILKRAGLNVGLAGNVGQSFALQVAEKDHDHYVLELSSFQLDNMYSFRANIAILTNITPDHLDRYEYKLENYVNSKFRILQNQTKEDALIYCADDPITNEGLSGRTVNARMYPFSNLKKIEEGAYADYETNTINITTNNTTQTMSIFDLALQGKHNAYNSMASGIAARLLEIRKETIRECLMDFQNVEHRLEFVTRVHGIEFINDSKATNVNSTWYALESINKPIVWIVGGVDKGNDYSMLDELVQQKVQAIVCLGTDNSKIVSHFSGKVQTIVEAKSADEAVALSYRLAKKDQAVLLSPSCASFDLFENYEERGQKFKQAVKAL
ncbi:MAG TPA: UDP-N-acetylmuramoyl-L-alanine--D-glutamate ligase [Flavobacteriales bacterium]|nr:UDP-N-acetylmuramoyl-L-alanine--D-glutamate ligase [Flavobacteriales bacterium]